MPELIIVSACLAGINCRYNSTNGKVKEIEQLVLSGRAIPVCPEVLGGLDIPRIPCEIIGKDRARIVTDKDGRDMTLFFQKGAEKTLAIAKTADASVAILKSRSPSCGCGEIYDGSFGGIKIKGNGFTADLLLKNNFQVLTEENFNHYLK